MADGPEINAQICIGGLGDLDGDERTLSQEAYEHIADIARTDLRDRYTDLDADDTIHILAINAPNIAIFAEKDNP